MSVEGVQQEGILLQESIL